MKPTSLSFSTRKPLILGGFSIFLLVFGFGAWAALTTIHGAIIAPGLIEVEQNRQVVQHAEGGTVREILVSEGAHVEAGAPLIALDDAPLRTRLAIVEGQLFELMARRARLEAERDETPEITQTDEIIALAQERDDVAEQLLGQAQLFAARRASADLEIEQLGKRATQVRAQIDGLRAQARAIETQTALLQIELDDQKSLLERGLSHASKVSVLQRDLAQLQGRAGEALAQISMAEERITEFDLARIQVTKERREAAIAELRDIYVQQVEAAQQRQSLLLQIERLTIRAPVGGRIYGQEVFAQQAVIAAGQPLMFIIPQDRPMIIAAQIAPTHVDMIHVGQRVRLRLPSFDAQTTPELTGFVTKISADTFADPVSGGAFYRAEIALSDDQLERLPAGTVLIPGMPVETFLATSERSPMAYLLKPLTDYFTRAFREG